jgi:hypothetical protein
MAPFHRGSPPRIPERRAPHCTERRTFAANIAIINAERGTVESRWPLEGLRERLASRSRIDEELSSHYIWSEELTPNNPYPDVVKFSGSAHGFGSKFIATGMIDTSFPKGKAMSEWLVNVGGSTVAGQLPIAGGEHSYDEGGLCESPVSADRSERGAAARGLSPQAMRL